MSSLGANTGTGTGTNTFTSDFSTRCLFCRRPSSDLSQNTSHMLRAHGFSIPDQDHLAVDLETLLEYLDMVINVHAQCIHCFTQRATGEAARQHMLAKGHCVIDVSGEESEYRDFYDWQSSHDEERGQQEEEVDSSSDERKEQTEASVRLDDGTMRLASGKLVSNRTARRPRRPRAEMHQELERLQDSPPAPLNATATPAPTSTESASSTDLSQLLPNDMPPPKHLRALATLRATDQQALAHLPAAQQRALLATQLQQRNAADRAQRTMDAQISGKGNKTMMKFFLPRVPKRKNGQHRESLRA